MKTTLFLLALLAVSLSGRSQQLVAYYPFLQDGQDSSGHHFDAHAWYGATFSNGALIGSNDSNEVIIPRKIFNGRLHFVLSMDVKFDTLQTQDTLPRNTILYGGNPICGPIPLGLFYCTVPSSGQPQRSWYLWFNNVPYTIPDTGIQGGIWYHLEIRKQNDSVDFFRDGVLLQSSPDQSDSLHFTLDAVLGQFSGCLGIRTNKSLWGAVGHFRLVDPDQAASAATEAVSLNIPAVYPVPAVNQFQLEGGNAGYEVEIRDLNGHLLWEAQKYAGAVLTISCERWPSGMYLLHYFNALQEGVLKIEVTHAP